MTTIVTIAMGTSEKDTWYLLEVGVGELKGGREPSSLPPQSHGLAGSLLNTVGVGSEERVGVRLKEGQGSPNSS